MIRLLSIQAMAERGGSDHALLRMVRSLPSDEFEVHIVVPAEPPLRAAYENAGATVHIVPMQRISTSHDLRTWANYALGWPLAVARLTKLIRRLDITLVHTNVLHSWYGWAAAALTRRPHVWHAREIVVQSRAALAVERVLTKWFAVKVLAGSAAIAAQLRDDVDVEVVYEYPDPTEFHPERAGAFRARAGIADDVPLVGAAGRIDTWKGVDVLLDAWPAVRRARGDAQLVVVGAPVAGKEAYADELARRAAALPGTHWLGERHDVADLLADLDVFVMPSTEPEPYGLALVEALCCGAPSVATDAGGAREIARRAVPGAVRLVPPRDAGALADAIVEHLDAHGRSSTPRRHDRPALTTIEPPPFAALLRAAVRTRRNAV
jgi:glycosyltransferase involved in cell wall biosynthesis